MSDVSQDGGDPDPDGNGDPGDNDDPTPLFFALQVIGIPTLSAIGLSLLVLLLGGVALAMLSRRRLLDRRPRSKTLSGKTIES